MRSRRYWKLLFQSFKVAGMDIVFKVYLGYFILDAIVIWLAEPSIRSLFDSAWYCFAVATTVGFGDITAITFVGRLFTIILSTYSIAVVAIFTAIIASFFMDIAKVKAAESTKEFLYELEHLPELSKEELQALSDKIKKYTAKRII